MNVRMCHQFVELLLPAPTQTEVTHAHVCQGSKLLAEVVLVSCNVQYDQQELGCYAVIKQIYIWI